MWSSISTSQADLMFLHPIHPVPLWFSNPWHIETSVSGSPFYNSIKNPFKKKAVHGFLFLSSLHLGLSTSCLFAGSEIFRTRESVDHLKPDDRYPTLPRHVANIHMCWISVRSTHPPGTRTWTTCPGRLICGWFIYCPDVWHHSKFHLTIHISLSFTCDHQKMASS